MVVAKDAVIARYINNVMVTECSPSQRGMVRAAIGDPPTPQWLVLCQTPM